jgi:hypothetical protein
MPPALTLSMPFEDWWTDKQLFYMLPNRLYWFLGAQTRYNGGTEVGEWEWYSLDCLCRKYVGAAMYHTCKPSGQQPCAQLDGQHAPY